MYEEIEHYPEYLESLLRGDRRQCSQIVNTLLQEDIPIKKLYVSLLQRALYEIGDMWAGNLVSVDVEHMATAVTESLFPLVYQRIFSADHIDRKAIVSCIANEYHQIGGKMVADILEMNGWDTVFLGADSTTKDLLKEIENERPNILALSLSLSQNIPYLQQYIGEIRTVNPELPIVVGGQGLRFAEDELFNKIPSTNLIRSLNALEEYLAEFH